MTDEVLLLRNRQAIKFEFLRSCDVTAVHLCLVTSFAKSRCRMKIKHAYTFGLVFTGEFYVWFGDRGFKQFDRPELFSYESISKDNFILEEKLLSLKLLSI